MGRRSQALHRGIVDFVDRLCGIPRVEAMVKDNTALLAAAEQARHAAEESRQRTDQIRRSREETDRALEGAIERLHAWVDSLREDDEDGHPPIPEGWVMGAQFPKGKYLIIETDEGWDLYHEDDHGSFS